MGIYARYVLPHLIDVAMKDKPINRQRAKIVPEATGSVLEIGLGSGRNLPHYDPAKVKELIGLEPSPELTGMAKDASGALPWQDRLRFVTAGAEAIPLDDKSVDTIVMTYTLCSIPEALRALAEMRRVLKKSGQLLFSEHGKSPDLSVRRWQNWLNPVWKRLAGGCNMNRDIPQLLRESGFRISDMERLYLPGPRVLRYNYLGRAVA